MRLNILYPFKLTVLRPAVLAITMAFAGPAAAAIEEGPSSRDSPVTTTWFALRSDKAQQVDAAYVADMRPHHAGALTMSADYLRDPGRSSPLLQALSRVIVINQRFEIGMLDEVGRNLAAAPLRLPFGIRLQPVATENLTGESRFFKAPIPSALGHATGPVSEADVRFAKAMIVHHEAAVEMASGYLRDEAARNGFLGLMNVDIVTDQTQEIALMRRVIAAYAGDAAAVDVPPGMIHGMEGMRHAGHGAGAEVAPVAAANAEHGHHGAPASATTADPTAATPSASSRPRPASSPVTPRPAAKPDPQLHHH